MGYQAMSKKEKLVDLGHLTGWSSNTLRKSDARVTYRALYPKAKTRWMGHGPAPVGRNSHPAQK